MPITLPIKKMSKTDKLRAMEELWLDLSRGENIESPDWHFEALRATEEAVKAGKVKFTEWEQAKKAIRRQAQ